MIKRKIDTFMWYQLQAMITHAELAGESLMTVHTRHHVKALQKGLAEMEAELGKHLGINKEKAA